MRCMNCGLPLSPARNVANCPRCGAPLNAFQGAAQRQFEQTGWENMGGMPPQNPWGQAASPGAYNPFLQQGQPDQAGLNAPGMNGFNNTGFNSNMGASPLLPRRPGPPPRNRPNPRTLFMVAGLCVFVSALILGLIALLVFSGNPSSGTANTNGNSAQTPTTGNTSQTAPTRTANASASPTAGTSPTATGTVYPGQQYISDAQMVANDPTTSAQPQPTTTFTVGSKMYVIFNLHPPAQGGAVCTYWYLNGNTNPVTTFQQAVKSTSRSSYTYAIYGSTGQAYVELYWANDKTCANQILAQRIDFTVTN